MRKNLFFLLAMASGTVMLPLQQLSAQSSSPYWSLAGNSNASSSSKLGTTNSVPLRLFTNNSTRLYISSGGNVGIGSSSPVHKLHVSGTAYISGKLGIGTTSPAYKLQVNGNASIATGLYVGNNGVYGYNSGGPGVYASGSTSGVYAKSTGDYGVYATNTGTYGVYATGANYGIYGSGGDDGLFGNGYNGLYASANNSNGYGALTYGGVVGTYGSGSVQGIYGNSYSGEGVRGYSYNSLGGNFISYNSWALEAKTTNGTYAGVFYGKVYSSGGFTTSDKNLKKNIQDFPDAMSIINKLKPKYYEFKEDAKYAPLNLPKGKHYGLMAQDLEVILPNLVSESKHDLTINNSQGLDPKVMAGKDLASNTALKEATKEKKEAITIKAVNYTELIPILVKAVQELSKENELLKQQMEELKRSVKLSQNQPVLALPGDSKLGQNAPNPGIESTKIPYSIPEGSNNASLIITDNQGRTIKTMKLTSSGVVNIDASTLSNGVYNYSLLLNNRTVETKKMTIMR